MLSRFVDSLLLWLIIAGVGHAADDWQRHLPPECLGVVVVNDLPEFDRQAARLAKRFGMEAPGLVRLLDSVRLTAVTDARGSWIAGLARGPQGAEEPYPFVMIPTGDFAAFVKALDGDLAGRTAIITLAQQDLLAGACGRWALLMNLAQQEVLDHAMKRATDERAGSEPMTAADGIVVAHVSKLGLQWLANYKPVRKSAHPRRMRGLAMLSLDGARESLVLEKPVWQWMAAEFEGVLVAADFDEGGGARLRIVGAKPQAAGSGTLMPGEPLVADRPWISVGAVSSTAELLELASGGYLALFKSRPDELGVEKFAEPELSALGTAIKNAGGQVTVAQFAILADSKLPIYGNRVAVLNVEESGNFLTACDKLVQHWNALIEASKAEVELLFTSELIEISGKPGKRYFVDMVAAVDVPRSPEVTKVMTDMFGAEGVLNWYVLPLDGERVLVADLPLAEVEVQLGEVAGKRAKPQAAIGSGWMQFDASAYVDWGKRRDRAMMGEVVGGPPFVPLPKSEPLNANMQFRDGGITIELTLPHSLLETLGKHSQETRVP